MIKEHNPNQEAEALKTCIKLLENEPTALSHFLDDLLLGHHKKWGVFKRELAFIKEAYTKGRSEPTKKSRPSGNREYANLYARSKHGIGYTTQLPLHTCDSDKQRAKMIMESDCSPAIKVDLLSILKF